ncbi:hypothetical protein MLD38_011675 [Melastoma candidum]|uniref:Uncharacterized protein n=1 Tax=Melastoma candidum TaxID=119954 RepID=A0ACB9R3X6_9MYRT|nr:hypothetical protein MLD38_011675 [Melastoma candidum]
MHPTYAAAPPAQDPVTVASSSEADASPVAEVNHCNHFDSLLYGVALLKEKLHQIQSLVGILVSHEHHHDGGQGHPSMAVAVAGIGDLIQEVMMNASSMMFACQQMTAVTAPPGASRPAHAQPQGMFGTDEGSPHAGLDWYVDSNSFVIRCCSSQDGTVDKNGHGMTCNDSNRNSGRSTIISMLKNNDNVGGGNNTDCDVIEPGASELLAMYTHYCQICGKGFKRDANLRMHMRAHGDEHKSNSALSSPMKNGSKVAVGGGTDCQGGDKDMVFIKPPSRKYSCPQEGCRWNKKHSKFQPLKSMICVKNHYKRSHCPKMYICKRCNRKQFSVLSDLRTHEKHCGNLKWQCSCGTTFSRKDKLMGHVTLFVGHTPVTRVDREQQAAEASLQYNDDTANASNGRFASAQNLEKKFP